jgi:hypothetical protein
VSVLVVAHSSSEIPEGLMNNSVYAVQCVIGCADIRADLPSRSVCNWNTFA